jgi:hypothetical protein
MRPSIEGAANDPVSVGITPWAGRHHYVVALGHDHDLLPVGER